uniref:Uncharacterized protein n=1 Tax=Triticum urartu TaxID=4572 RepID=A0A8R7U0Y2_TRIUA
MNAISCPNPCSRVPTSHMRPPDDASKKGSDEHRRRRPQRGQGFHPKQSVMVGGRRGPRRSLKGGNRRQRRRQRRGLRRKPRVSPGRPPQRPTPRPKRSAGPDLTRSAQTREGTAVVDAPEHKAAESQAHHGAWTPHPRRPRGQGHSTTPTDAARRKADVVHQVQGRRPGIHPPRTSHPS